MKDTKDAMANPIGTVTTGAEDPRPTVSAAERHDGLRVNLPYTDLREWMDEADRLGELRGITGASWQEEIGMAAELALHSDAAPCLVQLFRGGTIVRLQRPWPRLSPWRRA